MSQSQPSQPADGDLVKEITAIVNASSSQHDAILKVANYCATHTAAAEKAYGGCHLCYGKGYHTKCVGTSSRYGNATHDTIGYCSCSRGKQLEERTAAVARGAEQNAVAWCVGIIDEFHSMPHQDSSERDKFYKGVKNGLRDRFRSETGIDPAPNYPVNAKLLAQAGADELTEPEDGK